MTFSTEKFLTITVSCHEAFSMSMKACSVCVDQAAGQSGFGGAATLRAYKTGDVDYIDIDDHKMTKAEIRSAIPVLIVVS